jgi:plastocyanin
LKVNRTLAGVALILLVAAGIGGGLDYIGSSHLYSASNIPKPPAGSVLVVMVSGAYFNQSMGFSPANITLVLGVNSTVMFYNNDVAVHTATALDKSFNTGDILAGQSVTVTFNTTGTFSYYCIYHLWMVGSITVVAGP